MNESGRGSEGKVKQKCGDQWDALKARAAVLKQAADLHVSAALSAETKTAIYYYGRFRVLVCIVCF